MKNIGSGYAEPSDLCVYRSSDCRPLRPQTFEVWLARKLYHNKPEPSFLVCVGHTRSSMAAFVFKSIRCRSMAKVVVRSFIAHKEKETVNKKLWQPVLIIVTNGEWDHTREEKTLKTVDNHIIGAYDGAWCMHMYSRWVRRAGGRWAKGLNLIAARDGHRKACMHACIHPHYVATVVHGAQSIRERRRL